MIATSGPPPKRPPLPPRLSPDDGEWEVSEVPLPTSKRRLIYYDPSIPGWCTPDLVNTGGSLPTIQILEKRRFNHAITPPPLRPIFMLGKAVIATPGNLVAISSAVKTGKSAVIGAMIASTMHTDGEADLLGFASSNPKGLAVIHFDSEQSPDDHWHCLNRALKRAKVAPAPAWLYSYWLTGLDVKTAQDCVKEAVDNSASACGGVHSILLDGIADLVNNVNDPEECNAYVAQLHDMAIQHDCSVVGVIHCNPGSEKTRGHLGSQFERKAETNLRLEKDDDDITTMWSDKQRRAPIAQADGPAFAWSDEANMHVSVENPTEARAEARADAKQAKGAQDARVVFEKGKKDLVRYKELVALVASSFDISPIGARCRIKRWVENNIVGKDEAGSYRLITP